MNSSTRRLLGLFLIGKFFALIIAVLCAFYIAPYSPNTDLFLEAYPSTTTLDNTVRRLLAPFARWDSIYFLKIAHDGYQFEQQHAFFPLYPMLIRLLALLTSPLSRWLSLITRCMISGVLISLISHLLTVCAIFKYSNWNLHILSCCYD